MIIAIDQTPLLGGHKGRGVGEYTRLLLAALKRYEPSHTYITFTKNDPFPGNADVVHFPYFDPFFRTLPLIKRRPTVVTVHDLTPIVFPDKFPKGKRGTLVWQLQRISLSWSSRIITDSQCSKKDIVRIVRFPEHRIDVVPLAPDPVFKPVTDTAAIHRAAKTYHLPPRYILYVGDVNWNKNIGGLLRVFRFLAEKDKQLHLVLAGGAFLREDLPEAADIDRLILDLGLRDRVIRPGRIAEDDLPAVYSRALLYVQPSWYEGFGFPVLEAMACGCPAVVSNTPSLKEIAGPAVHVDMADERKVASAIGKALLLGAAARKAWAAKGIAHAATYTWMRTAHETVRSYGLAMEKTEGKQ